MHRISKQFKLSLRKGFKMIGEKTCCDCRYYSYLFSSCRNEKSDIPFNAKKKCRFVNKLKNACELFDFQQSPDLKKFLDEKEDSCKNCQCVGGCKK